MRLAGREDIALGAEAAFRAVTDVAYLERQLLRRGIDVVRTAGTGAAGPGSAWAAEPDWRGRRYPMVLEVADWNPSERALVTARSGGITGDLEADLAPLSRSATRLRVTLTLRASGFRDRMLLNSLTLAKTRLSREFAEAVTAFARGVEARAVKA